MQRAYQCRVQSACFCCPKDNILSPLAHFTARQTQTAGGRERLGPKSATKNCLKPDIAGEKRGIKSGTSAQRHFNDRSCLWLNLLSSPQDFLIRQKPSLSWARGIISKGQELCLGEWACQSCEVTWLCGLLRKPGVQWEIVLDMNRGTPIHVLMACV